MPLWAVLNPNEKLPPFLRDQKPAEPKKMEQEPKLKEMVWEPPPCDEVNIPTRKYQVTFYPKTMSMTILNKKGETECRKISIKTLMELLKIAQGRK